MAPHAIFIAPDHKRYSEISARIMEIFNKYTPLVEPISLDEAFLDVSGSERLFGSGREIAVAIRSDIEKTEGITCSVGIATSKFIAKLASSRCKPNGMLEITHDRVLSFLHPLPVSEIWGVGPKTNEELLRLGLRNIADIANTPRQTLIRALGEATGSSLYELAWGRDYRDVVIDEPEKSISAAETFAYDLENEEEILREYLRLCEKATSRMRSRNLRAKTVSIKVRFADFKTISRSKTFPLAINGTQETFAVVKQLYEALDIAGARLRLVGVGLENLVENEGAAHQPALGEREIGWAQAEAAVDRAIARFGSGSIKPARLVENESTSTSEQDSD